jgi:hypothetical protein
VPYRVVQRSATPRPEPQAQPVGQQPAGPQSAAEVEELARRLLEPLSRLLRADLRQGRERAGRLYDSGR